MLPYLPGEAPPKVRQYICQIRCLLRFFQLRNSHLRVSSRSERFLKAYCVLQAYGGRQMRRRPVAPATSVGPVQEEGPT